MHITCQKKRWMEIHIFLWENVFAFFFFQQIDGAMFTVLTEWTPGSSSKHVVWYNKAQEESDNISSLSSLPTALIHLHPREGHILHPEACRSTGRYQLLVIPFYILRKICAVGFKPGFETGTDELNQLQRPNSQKE